MKAITTVGDDRPDNALRAMGVQEEEALRRHLQEHRDIATAERLIGRHVEELAAIGTVHFGRGVHMEELIGDACVGLTRAARSYDRVYGTKFATCATWWMPDAMPRSILRASRTIQGDAVDAEIATAMTPLFTRADGRCD